MRVTIFDDSGGEGCYGQCSPWGTPELARFAADLLREQSGDDVEVEYVDLAAPQGEIRYPQLVAQLRTRALSLPAVAINGVLRLVGHLDYRTLVEAIDAEKEVGRG